MSALLYHSTDIAEQEVEMDDDGEDEDGNEDGEEELLEMSFMELQYGFEAIAVQLFYRFGVRTHHKVSDAKWIFSSSSFSPILLTPSRNLNDLM